MLTATLAVKSPAPLYWLGFVCPLPHFCQSSVVCIAKKTELGLKYQIVFAHSPITELGEINLNNSFILSFRTVVFIAVHEHHNIRVLFDGARFAQVAHQRALVGALFDFPR